MGASFLFSLCRSIGIFIARLLGMVGKASFGYGVIAAAAKRIAAEDAPYREDQPAKKATFLKCFESIGGAGRGKPAAALLER